TPRCRFVVAAIALVDDHRTDRDVIEQVLEPREAAQPPGADAPLARGLEMQQYMPRCALAAGVVDRHRPARDRLARELPRALAALPAREELVARRARDARARRDPRRRRAATGRVADR